MVSILYLITRWPGLFSRFLGIVPRASNTIGITVICMHHNLFGFLAKSRYFMLKSSEHFWKEKSRWLQRTHLADTIKIPLEIKGSKCQVFAFLHFQLVVRRNGRWRVLFFWLINNTFPLQAGIGWSVCISKSHRVLCLSFSRTLDNLTKVYMS